MRSQTNIGIGYYIIDTIHYYTHTGKSIGVVTQCCKQNQAIIGYCPSTIYLILIREYLYIK